jgi:hypothetical protein
MNPSPGPNCPLDPEAPGTGITPAVTEMVGAVTRGVVVVVVVVVVVAVLLIVEGTTVVTVVPLMTV